MTAEQQRRAFGTSLVALRPWLLALGSSLFALGAAAQPALPLPPTLDVAPAAPVTITLSWPANAETNVTGYRIYTNGILAGSTSTNTFSYVTAASVITNEVTATNSIGLESRRSPIALWPKPITNIVVVVSEWVTNLNQVSGMTNWSVTLTNPSGVRLYRHRIEHRTL